MFMIGDTFPSTGIHEHTIHVDIQITAVICGGYNAYTQHWTL